MNTPDTIRNAREFTCQTCGLEPPFSGWDDCLKCGTACALVEDPDYLAFCNRVYASDSKWLAALNAEWKRQSTALASREAA